MGCRAFVKISGMIVEAHSHVIIFFSMLKYGSPGKSAAKLCSIIGLEVFVSNSLVMTKTIAHSWSGCSGLLWDGDAKLGRNS